MKQISIRMNHEENRKIIRERKIVRNRARKILQDNLMNHNKK